MLAIYGAVQHFRRISADRAERDYHHNWEQ